MKKQNGISQIFVMVVMLILAIALPVTANLVKKVQDNRSSAAVSSCSSKGGACVTSYTGMSSGITCSGSSRGTNGGTTNTSYSCLASDGSSSGKVCCVPNSSNSTSGSSGTGTGAEACVAKSGACQTNGGSLPAVNAACSVNGKTGTYQTNLCVGQYNSGYRCCVPDAASAPAAGSVVVAPAAPAVVAPVAEVITCEGYIYLKTYPDVANDAYYGTHPQAHYNLHDGARVWSSATCIGDIAYNCEAGHGSPYNTETCQYGCVSGHCNGAPAPVCTPDNSCASNTLVGQSCTNNCGQAVSGVKPVPCVPDNSCASNTLVGQSCTNNCGQAVSGVKPVPVNGALGPANGTIVTTKPTSAGACSAGSVTWTDDVATDGTYNWTCAGINGGTSVNGSATKADCTVGNQKCTTGNKYYICADGLWSNSTTLTTCSGSKVCTIGDIGPAVCREPEYAAPNLNMLFAISGVKAVNPCFGDLKFKINVAKDGVVGITKEVTAIVMANSFNKNGDQVFKIADFALTSNYALTDKIKISVGGKKSLATSYGKDNQTAGFAALNESQLLVSGLSNNTLKLYEYPVLNGDIGSEGSLGTADNVVNGIDFAFMKSEWGKTCSTGQNLNADLNGDCRVDTFDLQILKNAMGEQYAQKTF